MIKSLSLRNFQSHQDTEIEFVPSVNIIVGQSRHGKTAIFRALKWLIENRPAGDEFKSHWADKEGTEVSLELDSGQVITRAKTDSDNYYDLNGQPFRGFGQDVPRPVAEALNIDQINTQFQFDTPYLLFDSPGQVAKTLNRIVHLDAIDRAMANAGAMKRSNDNEIRAMESRLAELLETEKSFPDLDWANEAISDLEDMQAEIQDKSSKLGRLKGIQEMVRGLRFMLNMVQIPAGVEDRLLELEQIQINKARLEYTRTMLLNIQAMVQKIRKMDSLLRPGAEQVPVVLALITKANELREKKTRLARARGMQDQIKALARREAMLRPILDLEPVVLGLVSKTNEIMAKKRILTRLRAMNEAVARARSGINQKMAIIEQEEKIFKELFPDKCPLCGR